MRMSLEHFSRAKAAWPQLEGDLDGDFIRLRPAHIPGFLHRRTVQPLSVERKAIPRDKWPLWTKAVHALSNEADKGIGDTIARIIGPIGGDAFKAWHLKIFKRKCRCHWRQAMLNQLFPYV